MSQANQLLAGLAGVIKDDFDQVGLAENENGNSMLLVSRTAGSPVLGVSVGSAYDAQVVRIMSLVVQDIADGPESFAKATVIVNRLNSEVPLGRFVYDTDLSTIDFMAEQLLLPGHTYDGEEIDVFRYLMVSSFGTIDQIDEKVIADLGSGRVASEAKPNWA